MNNNEILKVNLEPVFYLGSDINFIEANKYNANP